MKYYRRIPVPLRVSPATFLLEFAILVLGSLGASVTLAQKSTAPPVAPVRVAVSTISLAADSMADVSYAFSRIRILFWLLAAM